MGLLSEFGLGRKGLSMPATCREGPEGLSDLARSAFSKDA